MAGSVNSGSRTAEQLQPLQAAGAGGSHISRGASRTLKELLGNRGQNEGATAACGRRRRPADQRVSIVLAEGIAMQGNVGFGANSVCVSYKK